MLANTEREREREKKRGVYKDSYTGNLFASVVYSLSFPFYDQSLTRLVPFALPSPFLCALGIAQSLLTS